MRAFAAWMVFAALVAIGVQLASGARLERADFIFNNATEVATLDPATVTGVPEGRIIRAIFEGLVIKDPKTLEPVPGMAESWSVSEDGLTYTFKIREGAQWTNGDPVTAHDFVFSWRRFLDPRTAAEYAYQLWSVKGAEAYSKDVDENGEPAHSPESIGIRAPDDRTFVVELARPTPYFLDLCGFYPLFPVNRRNIEEAQRDFPETWRVEWLKPERLVTNGPFEVAFRRINDRIRLVKSETYWDRDHVALGTIDALAVENTTTALNLYLTGGCHWLDRVPTLQIGNLLPREDFSPAPYLGTYFYRVNVTKEPLSDPRIRKALSLTIPRQLICDEVTKAGQIPAYGIVPPGIGRYVGAKTATENSERARALLVEAGFGPTGAELPPIEIHYNTNEEHRDIAEVISAAWEQELGIKVKLLNQEWKVYLDTQSNLGYDVSRSAWIGDYNDPNTFADLFLTGGENNKTGWGNERYDELIAEAATTQDPEKRWELFNEAETILVDELPVIPIYHYVTRNLVSPRLGGFYENVLDEHFPKFFYWMSDEELAEKRASLPENVVRGQDSGPKEGLYAPAHGSSAQTSTAPVEDAPEPIGADL